MNRIDIKQNARKQLSANYWSVMYFTFLPSIIIGIAGVTYIGSILAAPLLIGSAYGLWQIYNHRPAVTNDLAIGYRQPHVVRNFIQLLLMTVFIVLWSLLLLIPGIVKAYSYAMVPYLLADPTVDMEDAITRSRQLMDGKKMDLFVLHLSFIGWAILGLITLNILNVFYTIPYLQLSTAGFYQELTKTT
jgi:uncharacterized membrane protein